MNTQRFALIDNNSGFIWWVGDAASPEEACKQADMDTNQGDCRGQYRWGAPKNSGEHGYFVYLAPKDFEVNDGQDEDEIEAVEALPFMGLYVTTVSRG